MLKLNLGSGNTPLQGYVNIDTRNLPGVDIVRDVLRGLPYADNTVDEIYSENFLEHIPQTDVIWIMNEIHRVLKPGSVTHHLLPQAGTVLFFQDPTHLSHWVEETFTYFTLNHHRNLYYQGAIQPWKLLSFGYTDPNRLITVKLQKP